jgi:hypothetical protein
MSPIGAFFLSILLITGIMFAGNSYESVGISQTGWIGLMIFLFIAMIVCEIRYKIKTRKNDNKEDTTQGE